MFNNFVALIIISMLFGALCSLLCCAALKKLKDIDIKLTRKGELIIIVTFGFLVYAIAEQIELSAILALQTNGICTAQYTFYNLNYQSKEESSSITKVITLIAEGFIFVYLGLTSVPYFLSVVSWSFILWEIVILMACRFMSIFGVAFIMEKLFRKSFRMKVSDKAIMSFAGTIRGCIAFGLAVSMNISNQFHKAILMSSTLGLVMITTLFFGALMPMLIKYCKTFDNQNEVNIPLISKIENNENTYQDPVKVITEMTSVHDHKNIDEHLKNEKIKLIELTHPNFQEE